ncbi:hypothetical protein D3C73_378280 [compost metagenome]
MEAVSPYRAVTEGMNTRQIKALHCLNMLQLMAIQRQTVNYETMAIMLGLPSSGNALAQAISPVLYDVFNFCKEAGLPHLTVLVVRKSGKDKDLPGPGFWKVYRPDQQLTQIERIDLTEEETAKCFRLFEKLGG